MKKGRLYKDTENKQIAGVCAGLGDYLEIDPNLIRIITVLVAFSGAGLILYIAAAILLPDKNEVEKENDIDKTGDA